MRCLAPAFGLLFAVVAMVLADPSAAAAEPDYDRDVRPILQANCYACHGPDEQTSGLRLDTQAGMGEGGYSGPAVVPGKPDESRLIHAVTATADATRMPPEDVAEALSAADIETLRAWIAAGAETPADDAPVAETNNKTDHWAFQPVARPTLPPVANAAWCRNGIDRFILSRLESEQLAPAVEAERVTLLRRASLDLVGLPPTHAELDAYLNDREDGAYERAVDRLLASPHYGERWGRHWLDAARYADSDGYNIDAPRQIWKYRDWVIDALNRDLPFDQFVIEQYAGDLLPGATRQQITATGFHRNTLFNGEGGTDREQFRVEAVVDRVATTGSALLGLTLGCARCHDHKFDPIAQQEFYEIFAYLNQDDEPVLELPTPAQEEQLKSLRPQIAAVRKKLAARGDELAPGQPAWEAGISQADKDKLPETLRDAFYTVVEKRNETQVEAVADYYRRMDGQYAALADELVSLRKQEPAMVTTMVLRQRAKPRQTHIHIRGDFLRHGREVAPGTPRVLPACNPADREHPTRLDLARWLVSPDNPLTPRVAVNRAWQELFGMGLVETENDFGTQGAPPSNPALLDWLAGQFVDSGWRLKNLHRLIVTSATYRQSSHVRPELADVDPRNVLLARQSRVRLDAETIRDAALAAAGQLSSKLGGPSVFPYQPDGVMQLTQINRPWEMSAGEDRYRRTLYTWFWRATPHPFLKTFDAPDGATTCTRRPRSNTPLQALTLLNDAAFYDCAQGLARRVLAARPADDAAAVRLAVRWSLSREPSSYETARLIELLAEERAAAEQGAATAAVDAPPSDVASDASHADLATRAAREQTAWTAVARVLLNLEEFMTRE